MSSQPGSPRTHQGEAEDSLSPLPRGARQPGQPGTQSSPSNDQSQYASYPSSTTNQLLRPLHDVGGSYGAEKEFHNAACSVDQFKDFRPNHGFRKFLYGNGGWTPWPLKPLFWIPYILILIGLAVTLEVMLSVSNKRNGWAVAGDITDPKDWLHYAVILPPAFVAAAIVAVWASTDIEIKKLQPYVDLVHGDSLAKRSLLLDYTRSNNFVSWIQAFYNKHFLVGGATLLVLISLVFQPLASALVSVRVVWENEGSLTTHQQQALGLNQNADFNDLTSFLTAAGYASSSILYDLGDIPFVLGPYTVAPFKTPEITSNGTATANTTAIKTSTNCYVAPVNMDNSTGNGNWLNTATHNQCTKTFNVSKVATSLFGTNVTDCDPNSPEGQASPQFKPVLFWFFTYEAPVSASATICYPSFTLLDVSATVDLHTNNLTSVTEIGPFTPGVSKFSENAANVTSMNGKPYNGIQFNITTTDPFVFARRDATAIQLPSAAFQLAKQDPAGFHASFDHGNFTRWTDQVYSTYLKLIAKQIYFLPIDAPVDAEIKTLQNRAFLSAPAVHILSTAFFLVALGSFIIHFLHYHDRKDLILRHEPGTLASAIYVGADTPFAKLIANRENDDQVRDALKAARFRLDPIRNKVIMDGDENYAATDNLGPLPPTKMSRADSLVAKLSGHGDRHSRRWSQIPPGTVLRVPETGSPINGSPPVSPNRSGSVPASPR
ncbi:hypothetical protein DL96DRAFT_1584277 [Flagelloscypha sp. PMI_526]|nr:hypothetical protein DL96DRAFT_1584277 [Flagelloscypha sp. PMI_526]